MIAVLFIFNLIGCSGFVLHPPTRLQSKDVSFSLWANKASNKNKRKKNPASSGGGFGKVAEKVEKDFDYSVFPALDNRVAETLIPSLPELFEESGELPAEMYDRLDQIYGFPNFNYESVDDSNSGSMSFDELISSSSSVKPTLSSDGNFADLLATGTGGTVSTSDEDSKMDSISSLPPFTKFRVLHIDPLVVAVDDFLTDEECDRYVAMSTAPNDKSEDAPLETRSMTVGKDALAKSQRTSTTWFHHYKNVPELMAKASRLIGLDGIDQWEEAQTVRYRRSEKFTWHLDALSPTEATPDLGGQRTATLIVYLTDLSLSEGGATIFRDLGPLKVQPKKGSAVLFFPAAGGVPSTPFDIRTLHCGETVDETSSHDKWISQLWLRQSKYTPSAPPGNLHGSAKDEVANYCGNY